MPRERSSRPVPTRDPGVQRDPHVPRPPSAGPRPARRSILAAATIAAGFGLLAVGDAGASTVDLDRPGGTMTIAGTAGPDDVQLSHEGISPTDPGVVQVTDFGGSTLTPGAVAAGCVANGSSSDWKCPRPARIVVHLEGGDDQMGVYEDDPPFTVPIEAHGGPGDDRLDGASGPDTLHGDDGDDRVTGRGGDDRLFGGDGNDTVNGDFDSAGPGGDDLLDGGAGDDELEAYVGFGYPAPLHGDDTYVGGPGSDSFSYFHRADPVSISLDGVANDGMAGEADNVHPDVESVGGGAGNDTIVGSPAGDVLWGSDGDDTIRGLDGDDRLSGDDGDDAVDGGAGADQLAGGCMTDTLVGGPGADAFYSDASPFSTCDASKRSPLDRIDAADGEPDALIFCQELAGPSGDTAIVDALDPVTTTGPGACGAISVVAGPGGGPAGGGGTTGGGPAGGSGGPAAGGGGPAGGSGGKAGTKGPKGTRRATVGKTLTLLTGTGGKGQAASMRIVLAKKLLTLGTLRATKRTAVSTTATVRRGGRTVTLGRTSLTVPAGATRTLQVKLTTAGARALRRAGSKVRVTTTFGIGNARYRKTFSVPVVRR